MKVYIHTFGIGLVKKSGVGRAISQQCEMLGRNGVTVSTRSIKGADCVHINTVFLDSVLMCIYSRITKRKVIYYAHSTMEDFKNSFIGSNFFAPLFKKWIIFCYNHGDIIITPTEYSKSLLTGYGIRKPIVTLSNGIDFSFWNKPVSNNTKNFRSKYLIGDKTHVVMSVGHLIERKGITDFIELAENMPHITFIWFGHTPSAIIPNGIKEKIKNAPDNLIFAGFASKEELWDAYHSCDVFCFMSHEETEGIVVLEALSSGIPTIVRDISVYKDWLYDNKNVRKCDTLSEFEKTISELLYKDNSELVNEGLNTAKSRDYDVIANIMLEQYKLLV